MGGLGFPEMLLILVVALIIFGPRKLPELGKTLGEGLAQFRKASDEFKRTWEVEVQHEKQRIMSSPHVPAAPEPVPQTALVAESNATEHFASEHMATPDGADEEHAASVMAGTVPGIDPTIRPAAPEPEVKQADLDWV
jgi:TatA/E family protein of Tat protein translocase